MGGSFGYTAPFQVYWGGTTAAALDISPLTGGPGNVTIQALSNGATGSVGIYALDSSTLALRQYISLDASGIINMQVNNGAASFQIATDGIVTITPSGSGKGININSASGIYKINNVQVVGPRRTGWAAWTGTANRTSFATGTATLVQVAEALKALMDDCTTHGLIGP